MFGDTKTLVLLSQAGGLYSWTADRNYHIVYADVSGVLSTDPDLTHVGFSQQEGFLGEVIQYSEACAMNHPVFAGQTLYWQNAAGGGGALILQIDDPPF